MGLLIRAISGSATYRIGTIRYSFPARQTRPALVVHRVQSEPPRSGAFIGVMSEQTLERDSAANRRFPRYPCRLTVTIERGASKTAALVRKISLGGMFIETSQALWVNAGLTARLGFQQPIAIECSVRYVEPGRGMGVAFAQLDAAEQQQLEMFIASLKADQAKTAAIRAD